MSIRKLSAPTLLPRYSKVPAARASSGSVSVSSIFWTLLFIRKTALQAWSSPNTDKTPRIWDNCPGTVCNVVLSFGLRKKASSDFSSSPRETRSSPTTLPIVCLSLTRLYNSSIQLSSGWGLPPTRTLSRRWARLAVRTANCGSLGSRSSKTASRYSTEVATSIASSIPGVWALLTVVSIARLNTCASGSLGGWSLSSDSVTRANCSATALALLVSPAHREDQTSLAETIRLRAWASKAGSKRPN